MDDTTHHLPSASALPFCLSAPASHRASMCKHDCLIALLFFFVLVPLSTATSICVTTFFYFWNFPPFFPFYWRWLCLALVLRIDGVVFPKEREEGHTTIFWYENRLLYLRPFSMLACCLLGSSKCRSISMSALFLIEHYSIKSQEEDDTRARKIQGRQRRIMDLFSNRPRRSTTYIPCMNLPSSMFFFEVTCR